MNGHREGEVAAQFSMGLTVVLLLLMELVRMLGAGQAKGQGHGPGRPSQQDGGRSLV